MKQTLMTIRSNRPLTDCVWEMVLCGDISAITAPGQFINIKLDGLFLRRPISVCDWDDSSITIIYKLVGEGTEQMAKLHADATLDVLVGLGNGFDIEKCHARTLVVGGGVGVPPMYGLAKRLKAAGKTPIAILGFNTKDEVFYEAQFRALGVDTIIATADGSYGEKGFVTNVLPAQYDYFCACGPMPMLKALSDATETSGLLSFEERMGCGFGACMGCSCKTKYGNKRICKDGPVLEKEEVIW